MVFERWQLLCVLAASIVTYMVSDGKFLFYVFAITVLIVGCMRCGLSFVGTRSIVIAVFVYAASLFTSLFVNSFKYSAMPMQSLAYPMAAILITGFGWRIFSNLGGGAARVILYFFVANAFVAALASFFGVSSIPLRGEIPVGRDIFLTDFPSSSGLLWNVNYYAATQAVGFWLCFFLYQKGCYTRLERWLLYVVALSIVIGSSRSCTLAFLVSVVSYVFFVGGKAAKAFIVIGTLVLLLFSFTIYQYIQNSEVLYSGLRVYKGLNSRDDLWAIGFNMFLQAPFLGYGDPLYVGDRLLVEGATNSTLQNSFLTYALTSGAVGFLAIIYIYFSVFFHFLRVVDKSAENVAVFSLVVFVFLDSFVRTYSIGGIGFLPLLMLSAIAYIHRQSLQRERVRSL